MDASRAHRAVSIAAVAGVAALAAPMAAFAADPSYFDARVTSSGEFAADYGSDRFNGDSRGFGTDGQLNISWRWELRTVAKGDQTSSGPELRSRSSMTRRAFSATTSLVAYDHNGGPSGGQLQESPRCSKPSFNIRTVDADDSAPGKGAWISGPREGFELMTGSDDGFYVAPFGTPFVNDPCLTHLDLHGLDFYETSYSDQLGVDRGEFNARFDRKFSKSYTDSVNLPLDHDGISPNYHTAQGSSTLDVRLKRLSESKAKKRNEKYKTAPVTGEADFAP